MVKVCKNIIRYAKVHKRFASEFPTRPEPYGPGSGCGPSAHHRAQLLRSESFVSSTSSASPRVFRHFLSNFSMSKLSDAKTKRHRASPGLLTAPRKPEWYMNVMNRIESWWLNRCVHTMGLCHLLYSGLCTVWSSSLPLPNSYHTLPQIHLCRSSSPSFSRSSKKLAFICQILCFKAKPSAAFD